MLHYRINTTEMLRGTKAMVEQHAKAYPCAALAPQCIHCLRLCPFYGVNKQKFPSFLKNSQEGHAHLVVWMLH